ncbi:MAG TPA: Fur family transcriptional regulator [Micropepsaceae bacterium]|nr:Fur family transcriptional regulator [Micropepsaceae bacterium]
MSMTARGLLDENFAARLRQAGLRPTRQRLALAKLLFRFGHRHLTAEDLHAEAQAARVRVSLATVYNTLHQFTAAGLLRSVTAEGSKGYFDTNTVDHHHFYCEEDGRLVDIDGSAIRVAGLPSPPDGAQVERIEVIVRLKTR